MRSWELYELKRHYQRDCHLRIDERVWEQFCSGKVIRRDARLLNGTKLETRKEQFMDFHVLDLCHKRPLHYDAVDGKLFKINTESSRRRIEIELLLTFFKSGGQLWGLEG